MSRQQLLTDPWLVSRGTPPFSDPGRNLSASIAFAKHFVPVQFPLAPRSEGLSVGSGSLLLLQTLVTQSWNVTAEKISAQPKSPTSYTTPHPVTKHTHCFTS
ncbi:hypothetical protein KIL84_021434 [Mauremys mutica]|uniref:Uncharacterized protein n=1 Tax=Mauremys mutica TaxID=74926 RepID=A0A9D4AZY2_9SAUR|nr:hypothetical protein KIL84_021434 [Mauremys mutica]